MTATEQALLSVSLDIRLRPAEEADLPLLEWFGEYAHFRRVFRRTFHDQQKGSRLMLVADCGGFPVGQIFMHFNSPERRELGRRLYLYSFRVMPMFRGKGIGSALVSRAEQLGLEAGCTWSAIAVAKDNPSALELYLRLGYRIYAEDSGEWTYLDHRGRIRRVHEPCWAMEKPIGVR